MADVVEDFYPKDLVDDLRKSGLTPADVRARPLGTAEKTATGSPMGVNGYVLPYFDLNGAPIQFYRVRLFDCEPKYKQLADTPNHVYFPPRLGDLLPTAKYILLTEGEKKAAAAVAHGFPCVALSGVDSWRTRTVLLPKDAALAERKDGRLSAKLPSGTESQEQYDSLAKGLHELINLVMKRNIPIIICYDNDSHNEDGEGVNRFEVQRAAAVLGYELRFRGVPLRNIRHLVLDTRGQGKLGLDDFLTSDDVNLGPKQLQAAITRNLAKRSAFPRHPNPRDYVNKRMQKHNIPRHELQAIGIAVLSDLDARGLRLRAPDEDQLYYFSDEKKSLTKVNITLKPDFASTPFGIQVYNDYAVTWSDHKFMGWLGTQFAGEEPVSEVYPEKVLCWRGDRLYYHLNDGTQIRVTEDSIDVLDNGADGVLFEAGMVEGISTREFLLGLELTQAGEFRNQWLDVLKDARIKSDEGDKRDQQRRLLSLLYYISPWFYRWRGTQLPVEITTGEAGSGKSTLYELRLDITTGVPKLRNSPADLRDWNAGLATTGALHVTDNVQMADVNLRQRLSDEICRLITEPKPSIEQRKLYTDTGIVRIPVRCVFGITAIKQPFTNVDIIQRAIITELDKGTSSELTYDADWKQHQLDRFGGRAQWLAHQLLVVQHILQLIGTGWEERYKAKYRLINVEQLLMIADQVFGAGGEWIPDYLEYARDSKAQDADWALEGLSAFAKNVKEKNPGRWQTFKIDCSIISGWCQEQEEFEECKVLCTSRALGRYIAANKHTVATVTGLVADKVIHGKQQYMLKH